MSFKACFRGGTWGSERESDLSGATQQPRSSPASQIKGGAASHCTSQLPTPLQHRAAGITVFSSFRCKAIQVEAKGTGKCLCTRHGRPLAPWECAVPPTEGAEPLAGGWVGNWRDSRPGRGFFQFWAACTHLKSAGRQAVENRVHRQGLTSLNSGAASLCWATRGSWNTHKRPRSCYRKGAEARD